MSKEVYIMACFTVSAVGAVGVAVARHIVKHHEKKMEKMGIERPVERFGSDVKWSKKLAYLELTLGGGSLLLAGEHIFHGEVTPYPPFITAMKSAEDTATMWQEIGTIGVGMFLILILAWVIGVLAVDYSYYRKRKAAPKVVEEK